MSEWPNYTGVKGHRHDPNMLTTTVFRRAQWEKEDYRLSSASHRGSGLFLFVSAANRQTLGPTNAKLLKTRLAVQNNQMSRLTVPNSLAGPGNQPT